jgi:hypothetical protein
MEPAKSFNNLILGQFVLSGVPIKVYVNGRFLTLTDTDDVEDPLIGFGMDLDGRMIQFSYPEVEFISVQGNKVDIATYNKGMEVDKPEEDKPEEDEPEKDDKKSDKLPKEGIVKEYTFGTGDIIKNINPKCKHFGSQGIVKKMMDIPSHGTVAIYTVTNNGDTFSPGDSLTKTVDQLEPVEDLDEKLVYYKDKKDKLRRFDTDKGANKKYEK